MTGQDQITVFVGVGSNLAKPLKQMANARLALAQLPHSQLLRVSSLYRTKPHGPQDQPDFINAVAELHTVLEPEPLLDCLQAIEREQGREREKSRHWGPRTLDLDMLLFGDECISTDRLIVPHPFMCERGFVLCPLYEIAPDLCLPNGQALARLLHNCPQEGVELLGPWLSQ